MYTSRVLGVAAFLTAALAAPYDDAPVDPRAVGALLQKRADVTAVWVSVDDEGQPARTVTPSATVVDGTTSIVDGAPHDITASVFTNTWYAKVSTSTGDIPNPSATNKNQEGAFPRCFNQDGDNAPFCYPYQDSTLLIDSTYYITWDPDFYNRTVEVPRNGTLEVSIRADYLNRTKKNGDDGEWLKLDDFDRVPASWGFYPIKIDKKFLKGFEPHNVTFTLFHSLQGSSKKTASNFSLPVAVDYHRAPEYEEHASFNRQDLIIALPATFGALILILIGGCIWNRKTRRVRFGNVMSRGRKRFVDSRIKRRARKNGDVIILDERDGTPLYEYRDDAVPEPPRPRSERRDSDLGSLIDTPVTGTFPPQGRTGGNTFRDELRRQDVERRNRGDLL